MGRIARLFGLALLVLALVVPALVSPAMPGGGGSGFDSLAKATICHAEGADRASGDPDRHPDPASAHDCALCPVCLTGSFAPPTASPADPPSSILALPSHPIATPPATGPPAPGNHASRPRAPPA